MDTINKRYSIYKNSHTYFILSILILSFYSNNQSTHVNVIQINSNNQSTYVNVTQIDSNNHHACKFVLR